MAIPVARVHLAVAHAALPALLPTPPRLKMMLPPLLPTPSPCPCSCIAAAAAILPKPKPKPRPLPLAKPTTSRGRADSDERWDARKTPKPACSSSTESSSPARSTTYADSSGGVRSRSAAGCRSSRRNASATSAPPKPTGRADAVERWDAHKKAAASPSSASSSSSSSSSGTSSLASSSSSSRRLPINRASSAERWDVHKKLFRPTQVAEMVDDGESSTTGSSSSSSDIDMEEEEEEIVWKPRAMYAGPGFVVAAPEPSLLPMPTAFLVPVA